MNIDDYGLINSFLEITKRSPDVSTIHKDYRGVHSEMNWNPCPHRHYSKYHQLANGGPSGTKCACNPRYVTGSIQKVPRQHGLGESYSFRIQLPSGRLVSFLCKYGAREVIGGLTFRQAVWKGNGQYSSIELNGGGTWRPKGRTPLLPEEIKQEIRLYKSIFKELESGTLTRATLMQKMSLSEEEIVALKFEEELL